MLDAASWAGRLGGDTFLAQTYHRSYAHIPGTAGTADLFSFDALNRIIASQRLEPPRLRLSLDGEMVPLHRYAIPTTNRRAVSWSRIQPAEFHAQLKDGASLVLDSVEKIHPAVGAAAEGLERFLGTSVQANAYASWTDREGFGLHWDDHDVVVMQVHGSKRWRLYGSTREAPTFRDVESPERPEGDPVADIVLSPGGCAPPAARLVARSHRRPRDGVPSPDVRHGSAHGGGPHALDRGPAPFVPCTAQGRPAVFVPGGTVGLRRGHPL